MVNKVNKNPKITINNINFKNPFKDTIEKFQVSGKASELVCPNKGEVLVFDPKELRNGNEINAVCKNPDNDLAEYTSSDPILFGAIKDLNSYTTKIFLFKVPDAGFNFLAEAGKKNRTKVNDFYSK